MPSSKPSMKTAQTPSLRQRATSLKSGLLRLCARPALPSPLPAPGSPEAVAAWEAARCAFDHLTQLSDEEYAALRIGDSLTLWTTEWVQAVQRGDFSRFSTRELPAARALTPADLDDLLVMTTRRDLRTAEAVRRTGFRTLYALAYPNGEPAPEPDPEGDDAHVMIAEHRVAQAAWEPHGQAWNEAAGREAYAAAERAAAEPLRAVQAIYGNLLDTRATTLDGLRALAAYVPEAVHREGTADPGDDAVRALHSLSNSVLALVPENQGDTLAPGVAAIPGEATALPDAHTKTVETAAASALAVLDVDPGLREAIAAYRDAVIAMQAEPDLSDAVTDRHSAAVDAAGAAIRAVPARALVDVQAKARLLWPEVRPDMNGQAARAFLDDVFADLERVACPDLSALTLGQLAYLYNVTGLAHRAVGMNTNAPICWDRRREDFNALGRVMEAEANRFDILESAIVAEARSRWPATEAERDERLSLLVRHALECGLTIEDRGLRAEAIAAWGA